MSLRSGLAASLGYKAESTWGTYAVPDHFTEMRSERLTLSIERIESQAIRASNRVQRSDRWVAGAKSAGGQIDFDFMDRGFGLLLKHMLGAVAITTPGGGTLTRDHTVTLGDMAPLSMTLQVGRPDTAGTVQPFSYLGAKVTSWELTNSPNGLLLLSVTFDAADETTAQSLASVSYPATQALLSYVGGVITVAGSAFDLRDFSLQGDNGLATDRHQIRASTLKKEQYPVAPAEVGGTLSADFDSLTAYNRFTGGTIAAVTALWEGATIEGALKFGLLVTLPAVRFDGTTPTVGGPEILTQELPFKVMNNGTDQPIELRYRTTDTVS